MADARSIILHHFDRSPFSEKVRLYLRMKNLAWTSVEVPDVMPKPDLVPLTGGYRRTPVMQIGADIFCDTAMILMELERRFPLPTLSLPGHEGTAKMIAIWTDRTWFQVSVGIIFGALGEHVSESFVKDREALTGRPFDLKMMRDAAPMLRDQWRAHLMMIEERLEGGRGAGSGAWMISTKPGLVDVHTYMNIWFVERNIPDFLHKCFEGAPLVADWYQRMKEFDGQTPESLSSEEALAIAKRAGPRLKAATVDDLEPQGLVLGEPVSVSPDDYGRDWVSGTLVHADDQCVILQRTDPKVESLHIHFPRAGYLVRRG